MPKKVTKPKDKKIETKSKEEISSKVVNLNNILINDFSEKEYTIEKGELSLDILEDDKSIFIESPVAGVKVDDINIDVETEKITIEGFRKRSKEEKNRKIKRFIHNSLLRFCY